jgi:apolipoprotein N-acyltransferase
MPPQPTLTERAPGRWAQTGPTAVALLAGLLHTAAFAPLGWWPLQIAALALLVLLLRDATPRRAAFRAWCFALAWLASGLWWLHISMHQFGNLPWAVAAMAVLLLSAALALYYAGAAWVWARWRRSRAGVDALRFAACWLGAELARGMLFTGFPWLAGGYAHTDGLFAPLAPWVGVYGIGAVAAWLAAGLALRWTQAAWLPLALAGAAWIAPQDFTRSSGTLSVSLLQPNVPQDLKFDEGQLQRILDWHAQALARAQGQLVLTSESVIPLPLALLDPAQVRRLSEPFSGPAQSERRALLGVFLGDEVQGYTNSLVELRGLSQPQQGVYRYGKQHLLPFGEFIPPGFGWFVRAMNIPMADQVPGNSDARLEVGGQRVRPLICYEDLFGEDIAASVVGPQAATVLANATNLAWFGRHMVQDQHLQFSRMRSLEFQRPIVRATNTGATAVVDHRGQVTSRLAPLATGTLEAQVQGRSGETPYARWLARLGLWPLVLVALATLLATRFVKSSRSS